MTKQEFAIKLLFWLMPWPLSKAFPGLLIHILTGPAAQTPLQWAQAAYDALAKYFTDATAYAQNLLSIIDDITPIDELTRAARILRAALENAAAAMATLTEIMADLEHYTVDQILQAFSDATNAMQHLTSATNALLQAIEAIPPEERPEIPPPAGIPPEEPPEVPPGEIPEIPSPPPPSYIPPFPPLYPGLPGQGISAPVYPSRKHRPRDQWVAYFDEDYWEPGLTASWDGTKWIMGADGHLLSFAKGLLYDFEPSKIRITFSNVANMSGLIRYRAYTSSGTLYGSGGLLTTFSDISSGDEIALDWDFLPGYIKEIQMLDCSTADPYIDNIEFYE